MAGWREAARREDPWLSLGRLTISGSCDVLAPEKARTIIDGETQGRIANKPRSLRRGNPKARSQSHVRTRCLFCRYL